MAVPPPMPVTTADEDPIALTVATAALLLLQVPPDIVSVNVSDVPWQMVVTPVIKPGEGILFTVTVTVVNAVPQVPVTEYVIVVVPVSMPVTTPAEVIVATEVLLLLQLPPDTVAPSVVVVPTHAVVTPVMLPASVDGKTVKESVTTVIPHVPVTL